MQTTYHIGQWQLLTSSRQLNRGAHSEILDPRSFAVLLKLAQEAPEPVTTEALLDAAWPGLVVGDNQVHKTIGRLRRIFSDNPREPHSIETLSRIGYRLMVPVNEVIPPSSLSASESSDQPRPSEPPTLAVLPLTNQDRAAALDFLGPAIATELREQLYRFDCRVIAATASQQAGPLSMNPVVLGRHLGARFLVQGSYAQRANGVVAELELIDSTTSEMIWQSRVSEDENSVGRTRAKYVGAAADIADALNLWPRTHSYQQSLTTDNVKAFRLVQRAVFVMQQTGNPDAAAPYVNQAIELDPRFALAHAVRGWLLFERGDLRAFPASPAFATAEQAITTALSLDAKLPLAHLYRGWLALRKQPNFREAMRHLETAEKYGMPFETLVVPKLEILLNGNRLEEGLALSQQREAAQPGVGAAKIFTSRFLVALNRIDEATRELEAALALTPSNMQIAIELIAHYGQHAKRPELANRLLDEVSMPVEFKKGLRVGTKFYAGDTIAGAQLIERWTNNRDTNFIAAGHLADGNFLLGNYAEHFYWTEVREQEMDTLGRIPQDLRLLPDYWRSLETWAEAPGPDQLRRRYLLGDHRERIRRITQNMVF